MTPSELQAVKERLEAMAVSLEDAVIHAPEHSNGLHAPLPQPLVGAWRNLAADLRALLLSHSEMEGDHIADAGKMVSALTRRVERLKGAAGGIDHFMLVIESAVRNADPKHHRAVSDALKAIQSALNEDQDHG